MSSTNKRKYTVVLYQAGLGAGHDYFNPTLEKIDKIGGSNIVFNEREKKFYNSFLDMSQFDCEKGYFYGLNNCGYLGKSSILTNEFNNKIAQIVDVVKTNPNKNVHVKTDLTSSIDFLDGFESIENQKIKLKFIINALKSYNLNLDIVLIGHSQGGLVNLETAIDMPDKISKMISIGTPYAPVSVAQNLLRLDRMAKLFKMGALLEGNTEEETARYEARANILTDKNYYSTLKKKWKNLSNRPKLMVITGTSGHVTRPVSEFVTIGSPPFTSSVLMSIDKKCPFDGLVLTSEQKDIDYDYNVNVTCKKIPCYDKETYTNKVCGAIVYDRCKGCNLPFFDGNASAFAVAMDALGGIDPEKNEIVQAIFQGVDRAELTDASKANYYNIYASDYSHMYISQCDETIASIIGFLN